MSEETSRGQYDNPTKAKAALHSQIWMVQIHLDGKITAAEKGPLKPKHQKLHKKTWM